MRFGDMTVFVSQPGETSLRRGGSADRRGLSWSDRWHRAEGGWKHKGQMEGSQRMKEREENRDGRESMSETDNRDQTKQRGSGQIVSPRHQTAVD